MQRKISLPVVRDAKPSIGSLTLLVFSTAALFAAILLPNLASTHRNFTVRRLWIMAQGIFGISMLTASMLTSTSGVILLFSIVGFSWAASVWIPFALLGDQISNNSSTERVATALMAMQDHDHEEKIQSGEVHEDDDLSSRPGLIYGMHNFSICLPQILVTLGMSVYSMLSASNSENPVEQGLYLAWVLRVGGIFGLVAMYLATAIRDPPGDGDEDIHT